MLAIFWTWLAATTPIPESHLPEPCLLIDQAEQTLTELERKLIHQQLPSGMRVWYMPLPTHQTVAMATQIAVGSRHENTGQRGYAHLFEHMLFEGSERAPGEAYTQAMQQIGGQFNAETFFDYTRYYVQTPAQALHRLIWLEADRFQRPQLSDDTVNNQKAAVLEETAMRIDNIPFFRGSMEFLLEQMAGTAYAHSPLGVTEDIEQATPASLETFFRSHYFPRHTHIALVGRFDPAQAQQLISEAFADWRNPELPPATETAISVTRDAAQASLVDERSPWPALLLAWHTVGESHADAAAVHLLQRHLLDMPDNRLQQLLRERQSTFLMQSISLPMAEHGISNLVLVPRAHVSLDSLRETVLDHISTLAENGISEQRLCELKLDFLHQQLQKLDDPNELARLLVANAAQFSEAPLTGRWHQIRQVSAMDLRRVTQQYFHREPIQLELLPAWPMRLTKTLLEWMPESWAKSLEDSAL